MYFNYFYFNYFTTLLSWGLDRLWCDSVLSGRRDAKTWFGLERICLNKSSSAWSIISEKKLAKSGAQKPCRILRRMKAAKRCLSLAEVNPHQALAAYNSLAMKTPRKTSKSPSAGKSWERRTLRAWRVCEQDVTMVWWYSNQGPIAYRFRDKRRF